MFNPFYYLQDVLSRQELEAFDICFEDVYTAKKHSRRKSMHRVVHFDISVDDPKRAITFYTDIFGWKFEKWEGPMDYWLVTTGPDDKPGINGGIGRRGSPNEATINTIDVPSIDNFMDRITEAGGKVVAPKVTIPGVGYYATCKDTEGNTFGIMEDDPSAT